MSAKHPPNEAVQGHRDPLTKRGVQDQPPRLTASSRSPSLPAISLPCPRFPTASCAKIRFLNLEINEKTSLLATKNLKKKKIKSNN